MASSFFPQKGTTVYPATETSLPTPLGTLDSLLDEGDTSAVPYKVFIGHNLGNRTFLITIPMHEFYKMSDVANDRAKHGEVTQRKLDPKHAMNLAVYMLKGLVGSVILKRQIDKKPVPELFEQIAERLGRQPYLAIQPIVANIRTCQPGGSSIPGEKLLVGAETAAFKVFLSQKDVLWVIDGQHRRKGMEIVFEFLDFVRSNQRYPKKPRLYVPPEWNDLGGEELSLWEEAFTLARGFCRVGVEVHLGLDADQERQLFHDLNRLGKKVDTGLALQFDRSNPINQFISDELLDDITDWEVVEKDIVDWDEDTGAIPRKDLVAVNALLFLNKTNISGAVPPQVEEKLPVARQFWEAIRDIPHVGKPGAKDKTVAAQPVVLKSLAKLVYDYGFGSKKSPDLLSKIIEGISNEIDFSHTNPMWAYYELSEDERRKHGLMGMAEYMRSDEAGSNRDIGKRDAKGRMRFGAKHNDIFPIIGDMIRWRLKLPNRNAVVDADALLDELREG
jgi:hypothetical protein